MRVTQQMLFNRYVYNLNSSLTSLMDLNVKAQTQKNINKPSDDPTGMTRILDHRDTLRSLDQYAENISTAKGWLTSADEALMQVSTIITRAKELATQAATGTVDENNREQISYEMRSLFEQLVSLANTDFEGNSIFGGHKTDGAAYQEIMWLTTNDEDFGRNAEFTVNGSSDTTVLVQYFDRQDNTPVGGNMALDDPDLGVRYSIDGGRNWLEDGSISFIGSEGTLSLPQSGTSVSFHGVTDVKVNDFSDVSVSDGTWMWIRPSAQYLGDDDDAPPKVDSLGPGVKLIEAEASGSFLDTNVTIRIDNESDVTMNEEIHYSYSMDGGINWVTGNVASADTTSNAAVLSVANGGILTLTSAGSNTISPGQQFIIRPRTAAINLDVSSSEQVQVNSVGKDIFGGIYMDPDRVLSAGGSILTLGSLNGGRVFHGSNASNMALSIQGDDEYSMNLFEVMGNLVAFTETNNQTGVQQSLANLVKAQEHIMNSIAEIGGRENRLNVGANILEGLKLNEQTLLSSIEDADVSELMTDLAQQQIVYESVLRSTSMIMQLNLAKFI
ncbi:flagellar hook-associated protein FlgL [Pseudodesulfovibrio indicus]|jgi:flagellar hook-associated protein 3 FlgL|uniref:Flagellar biosynthesis protein FlgL n=1 Tax=Pseudodesulfovibrio indicus TaxID=1716143 RepID=A0A126QQX5_9BACT|nr:flagellar hook-associated protein FlgL [Pseudodesulfovibrio indicus]AMK12148.1 flagellar biosynthesis protein FlgL [Pseudodesulfovibrio indicus]TDT88753.1 flagellar hook-associated protein 3 FlgL [Pseudodesulfovibrio indicus]